MKKSSLRAFEIIGIAVILLCFVIFLYFAGPYLGLNNVILTDFIYLMPGLLVFAIGITVVFVARGIASIPAAFFCGVGLAILIGNMNTLGLITTQMLSNLSLISAQVWIIIFMTMVGMLIAAATRTG
jgi:hypothetical protein